MSIQHVVGTGAEHAAPRVGVIGGGQLARMMQEAAVALGIQLHALVEAADGSAGQVIPNSRVGGASERELIMELATGVDAWCAAASFATLLFIVCLPFWV